MDVGHVHPPPTDPDEIAFLAWCEAITDESVRYTDIGPVLVVAFPCAGDGCRRQLIAEADAVMAACAVKTLDAGGMWTCPDCRTTNSIAPETLYEVSDRSATSKGTTNG